MITTQAALDNPLLYPLLTPAQQLEYRQARIADRRNQDAIASSGGTSPVGTALYSGYLQTCSTDEFTGIISCVPEVHWNGTYWVWTDAATNLEYPVIPQPPAPRPVDNSGAASFAIAAVAAFVTFGTSAAVEAGAGTAADATAVDTGIAADAASGIPDIATPVSTVAAPVSTAPILTLGDVASGIQQVSTIVGSAGAIRRAVNPPKLAQPNRPSIMNPPSVPIAFMPTPTPNQPVSNESETTPLALLALLFFAR